MSPYGKEHGKGPAKVRRAAIRLLFFVKTRGAPPCQGERSRDIWQVWGQGPPSLDSYSGLKFSLEAPQMGQDQEAGTASHLVPGFTSLSGSPSAGSYT